MIKVKIQKRAVLHTPEKTAVTGIVNDAGEAGPRRRGVPAARTWQTIPKETGDEPAPVPQSAPAPKQARRGLRWGCSG